MDSLPFVVLRAILIEVKVGSNGRSKDLLACSLVSRAWHHAAIPLLHGIIALTIPQADHFTQSFNVEKYAGHIISLTLRLDSKPTRVGTLDEICNIFLRLAPILKHMTGLLYFSLYRAPGAGRNVPHGIICPLLDALPDSCIGLELETAGNREDGSKVGHVCDSLRRVLPQLAYVRIRTVAMCSAMFGVDDDVGNQHGHPMAISSVSPGPVKLPNLRSMIINCVSFLGRMIPRCGVAEQIDTMNHQPPDKTAWQSVTTGLEKVIRGGSIKAGLPREDMQWPRSTLPPEDTQILVLGSTPFDEMDSATWQARICADMIRKESWAIPRRQLDDRFYNDNLSIMRLPDGREMVAGPRRAEEVIEGETPGNWCSVDGGITSRFTYGGARLPREVIKFPAKETYGVQSSFIAEICGGLPAPKPRGTRRLRTSAAWRQTHSECAAPPHWENEEKTGMRLFGAERRVGNDYLSLRPIVEITPTGWLRGYQGKSLIRIVE